MTNQNKGRGRPRKFDRDEAREIRRIAKSNESTIEELSVKYGVSKITLYKVVNGVGPYANTL